MALTPLSLRTKNWPHIIYIYMCVCVCVCVSLLSSLLLLLLLLLLLMLDNPLCLVPLATILTLDVCRLLIMSART